MTNQDEIPSGIKPDPKSDTNSGWDIEVRYAQRKHIYSAIVWTLYAFQLITAGICIYRSIISPEFDTTCHWTIVLTTLGSLAAIAWVEKNILFKDLIDGRSD